MTLTFYTAGSTRPSGELCILLKLYVPCTVIVVEFNETDTLLSVFVWCVPCALI